jgi:peptide deformylase
MAESSIDILQIKKEIITNRAPEVLQIIRKGHPTLARKADIVDPTSEIAKNAISDMIATLEDKGSFAGLAAPQVDIPLQIFLFCVPPGRGAEETIPLTPVINPRILEASDEMMLDWEACFSLPGLAGEIAKHKYIKYTYQNLKGEWITVSASGFHAKVIQHELDHLNGITYVERMTDMSRFGYLEEVREFMIKK